MFLAHFSLDFVELFFFFPSRYFIHLRHGICCLTVVGVSICINCCLLILPLLPTFVWSCVFIFFNVRAIRSHTVFSLLLCIYKYIQHVVRLLFAFALALALFFSHPLDTYVRPLFYVYDKTTFPRSDCWIGLFFNTFCFGLFVEFFFSLWHKTIHWEMLSSLQSAFYAVVQP